MAPPPDPALPGLDGYVRRKQPRGEAKKVVVKVGSVSVPIYRFKDRHAIIYREGKGTPRKTLSFKTEKEARAKAAELCLEIARGRVKVDQLTADELLQTVAARDMLAKRGLTLEAAARELDAALELVGSATIMELTRFWQRHHHSATASRKPAVILREMIEEKQRQGLDAEYLRNARQQLEKFAHSYPVPIGEITTKQIREYLKGLTVGPRTRNNVLAAIVMLFGFAQTTHDLPNDRKTEAEQAGRAKVPKKVPKVYTPAQLARWLGVVRDEWLPWMALGAFAGIRSKEISKMDWSDIQWLAKEIFIRPEVSKTGEGRYVPLQDNLALWLLKHRRGAGPIFPAKGRVNLETDRMSKIMEKKGEPKWNGNALRHSYGSHRLGVIRDLGKLTVEMGNSIAVNRRNYQNPRDRQSCVEYFSLVPAGSGRVIPINAEA